jgi:hypothetical protein
MHFAQPRTNVDFRLKMFGDRFGRLLGAPQVAGIDSANCMFRQHGHQTNELLTASLIEFRIRMATKPACHIRFGMAN